MGSAMDLVTDLMTDTVTDPATGSVAVAVAGAARLGGDLLAVRTDHPPEATDRLSFGFPGLAVTGEQVERHPVDGELLAAVRPGDRAHQRGVDPVELRRTVTGHHRRPLGQAVALAVRLARGVLVEDVHGPPVAVDNDLAEVPDGRGGQLRAAGRRLARRCGAARGRTVPRTVAATGGQAADAEHHHADHSDHPGNFGYCGHTGHAAQSLHLDPSSV